MVLFKAIKRWFINLCFGNQIDRLIQRHINRPLSRHKQIITPFFPLKKSSVELFRDSHGRLQHVRIGQWRVIAASDSRRIAEVRYLVCGRIAVRIDLQDSRQLQPSCSIWELYNSQGRLLAMLQTTHDNNRWLATNFETGRISQDTHNSGLTLSA